MADPLTPEEALVAILQAVHTNMPLSLKKVELMTMRDTVVQLAADALAQTNYAPQFENVTPLVRRRKVKRPDPRYVEAVRIVMGYEGPNAFLHDLGRAIVTYGGLTPAQADAVLKPPTEKDCEAMASLGVVADSVQYHWQALDACRDARTRLRDKIAKGATNG